MEEAPRAGLLHRSGRRRSLDRRGPGLRDRVRRAYSRASDPPAPVVRVRLRAPGQLEVAHAEGKIDTGSVLCAVPARTIAALNLPAVRSVRALGFAGAIQEVTVYRVDVEIDGSSSRA